MKDYVTPSQRVGITEAGDPAFNLNVFDHLYQANIIITKNLTDALIDKLIQHKSKCILHLTCTGYGGTTLEPKVPNKERTHEQLLKLLDKGFPVKQIVLRIDPCIPTMNGKKTAYEVAKLFSELGITRLRFSILDMYNHVKERFDKAGVTMPYVSFHASDYSRNLFYVSMKAVAKQYGYELEACGEPGIESKSCLSAKDIEILGLNDKIKLVSSAGQRRTCGCPANKSELIRQGIPTRCPHECLYCFWKDEAKKITIKKV